MALHETRDKLRTTINSLAFGFLLHMYSIESYANRTNKLSILAEIKESEEKGPSKGEKDGIKEKGEVRRGL